MLLVKYISVDKIIKHPPYSPDLYYGLDEYLQIETPKNKNGKPLLGILEKRLKSTKRTYIPCKIEHWLNGRLLKVKEIIAYAKGEIIFNQKK